MNDTDTTIDIQRIGTKKRRHVYVSREFDHAAEALLPEYVNVSRWMERQLWAALLSEHGPQAVRDAIEDAQADIRADKPGVVLSETDREELPIEA